MEANAGESFQMQILSNIFPRISLHFKLVPLQYREYEYGLLDAHNVLQQIKLEKFQFVSLFWFQESYVLAKSRIQELEEKLETEKREQ